MGPIVGQKAPEFQALSQQGILFRLSDFRGKRIVLFFSPRKKLWEKAQEVSAFRDCALLKMDLLNDPTGETVSLYGAWNRWRVFGKRPLAIDRSTFIIDESGIIRRIWRKVNGRRLKGHVEEVVAFLHTLAGLKDELPHQVFFPGVR